MYTVKALVRINILFLGYYVYFETSGQIRNKTSTITKQYTAVGQETCLTFWYHMYGSTVNTLNVYTNQSSKDTRIWTRSFEQGDKWYKAQATVNITQGTYNVSV